MLNCLLESCKQELFPESAVTVMVDKKYENYSGQYCCFEHGLADALNTVIKPENLSAFLTASFSGITVNNPQFIATAQPQAAQAQAAVDDELSILDDAANAANEVTSISSQEEVISTVTQKAARFNDVLKQWRDYSQDTDFKLDIQVITSSTQFDTPNGMWEIDYPSLYSVFSVNPAFSFNINFTPQSINLMFANADDNLSISGLDNFYSQDENVYVSAVDDFIKTLHNNIRGLAFNTFAEDIETAEATVQETF